MIVKSINEVDSKKYNSFSCGNNDLDKYLKAYALYNDKAGYGKTFLVEDNNEIVGYFTLSSSSITFSEYPNLNHELLPRYPIPCIRIARLAVKKDKQHQGYGKQILKQAFLRILNVSDFVGIKLIVVDAKKESISFYEKYGFLKLKNDKSSYFLNIETLKQAIDCKIRR